MVRPHTNEEMLQSLDRMGFEDLRPEFTDQVIKLRKAILNGAKPKIFHNQKLNGEMYCSMLNSYVTAINNGAVPNIENAWSYMCQEQCTKLINECFEMFERRKEELNCPCSEGEFSQIYEMEEEVYDNFRKLSVGEDSDRYFKELKNRIKMKINELDSLNKEKGKELIRKYMTTLATGLQKKIKGNIYT